MRIDFSTFGKFYTYVEDNKMSGGYTKLLGEKVGIDSIRAFENELGLVFPASYVKFLHQWNGIDATFIFYPISRVVERTLKWRQLSPYFIDMDEFLSFIQREGRILSEKKASQQKIAQAQETLGFTFPYNYTTLLQEANGADFLGWRLYDIDEVIKQTLEWREQGQTQWSRWNKTASISPENYVIFGADSRQEQLFAFDTQMPAMIEAYPNIRDEFQVICFDVRTRTIHQVTDFFVMFLTYYVRHAKVSERLEDNLR